jgi:adiponectin receptor
VLLIWGSFIPSIFYGFGGDMEMVRVYWVMVSSHSPTLFGSFTASRDLQHSKLADRLTHINLQITSIGVATSIVVLFPQFRTPAWRPFRAFMFVAMGLSAVVPVFHGIRVFGVEQLNKQMGLSWLVTQGFLYILGAGIYAVSELIHNRCSRSDDLRDGRPRWSVGWIRLTTD